MPFFGCGEELRNYMLKLGNVIGNSAWKKYFKRGRLRSRAKKHMKRKTVKGLKIHVV